MATLHAVMFGVALALTPSLVTLAFFLYGDWMLTRDKHHLEPHDWSLHRYEACFKVGKPDVIGPLVRADHRCLLPTQLRGQK
jgi:hypothetical protein